MSIDEPALDLTKDVSLWLSDDGYLRIDHNGNTPILNLEEVIKLRDYLNDLIDGKIVYPARPAVRLK